MDGCLTAFINSRPSVKISLAWRIDDLLVVSEHLRASPPAEQSFAKHFLQFAQLRGAGRLRDAQVLGGLFQAGSLRHGPEVARMVIIQPFHTRQRLFEIT